MSIKIAQALHQVMSKVSYVQKSGKNAFHGYKYAGEADLLEKLRPAMLEAGLLLIPSIKSVSPIDEHGVTTVQMEYTLVHKDGDIWPNVICAAGQGGDKNKNGVGDKGLYKAITGANKYLLFKLFQIETGDDPEMDTEERSGRLAKKDAKEVYAKLQQEMNSCSSRETLKEWGKNNKERINVLPEDWEDTLRIQFEELMLDIKQREAA
ncbi:ERF family protein [Bradyrhizobium sp. SZCCHNRI1073]|uniref:ERF family protein n=1 Tax=Bradyrhizobium sp. SZCCHNRI1073 TaxID=3057280 RepID=UPI002916D00A|nr:ERF family protein [Bradyrhizobium sp. SZCCHNRI1073]